MRNTDSKKTQETTPQRKKNITLPVTEGNELLKFLREKLADKSATTVKSYLTHRQVYVNDVVTTKFDKVLRPTDEVVIKLEKGYAEFKHQMLRIVFEDEHLLIIDKRNGLLSMATDKVSEKTAYRILSDYVKAQEPSNKVFIVHRLDRETSGLMMFARSQEVQHDLQQNWEQAITERKYVAVVEGVVEKDHDEITTYLTESSAMKVYVTNREEGRPSTTSYQVIKRNKSYTMLELELETGRKNQIRVHMQYIGHSIVGDKKYGAPDMPIGRIALHASKLCFIHPVTGKQLNFSTDIPSKFNSLFK